MLKAVRNRVPEWLKMKFSGPLRIIMRKEAVYFFSFLLDGPTTDLEKFLKIKVCLMELRQSLRTLSF